MKLLFCALIVHGLLTLWVGWQLYQLRSEINVAKEMLNDSLLLLDGIRVALAGSLKEKTVYLKDSYKTLKDVLFNP